MRILVYMPMSKGGIADYAHDQAEALVLLGHEVTMIAPPEFHQRGGAYIRDASIVETRPGSAPGNRFLRRARQVRSMLGNYTRLADAIRKLRPNHVLTHFEEYLAPFWVPRLRRAGGTATQFHTVLHDPERNYVVGPRWWHEVSVRAAFALYRSVFVHHQPGPADRPGLIWIPYGIHSYPIPVKHESVRACYGVAPENKLMVAFGFIRDNKNIDLVIRAMAANPQVELVVAGAEQGGGQKPVSFYKSLAQACGVAKRVHFDTRFLSQQETANLVVAADFGLLTYARSFVSASAAFSVYANYERPALVSSGSAEMERITRDYHLGVWVEPDDPAALEIGVKTMICSPPSPDWARYKGDNSWTRNGKLVVEAMLRSERGP
jgi:glycosyltransferase involved in cell wall biosynthesis